MNAFRRDSIFQNVLNILKQNVSEENLDEELLCAFHIRHDAQLPEYFDQRMIVLRNKTPSAIEWCRESFGRVTGSRWWYYDSGSCCFFYFVSKEDAVMFKVVHGDQTRILHELYGI